MCCAAGVNSNQHNFHSRYDLPNSRWTVQGSTALTNQVTPVQAQTAAISGQLQQLLQQNQPVQPAHLVGSKQDDHCNGVEQQETLDRFLDPRSPDDIRLLPATGLVPTTAEDCFLQGGPAITSALNFYGLAPTGTLRQKQMRLLQHLGAPNVS